MASPEAPLESPLVVAVAVLADASDELDELDAVDTVDTVGATVDAPVDAPVECMAGSYNNEADVNLVGAKLSPVSSYASRTHAANAPAWR